MNKLAKPAQPTPQLAPMVQLQPVQLGARHQKPVARELDQDKAKEQPIEVTAEQRKLVDQRKEEEQRRLEAEQRKLDEQRRQFEEEQRKQQEEHRKQQEEQRRLEEERRIEDQRRLEELHRLEELRRQQEQLKEEEQRRTQHQAFTPEELASETGKLARGLFQAAIAKEKTLTFSQNATYMSMLDKVLKCMGIHGEEYVAEFLARTEQVIAAKELKYQTNMISPEEETLLTEIAVDSWSHLARKSELKKIVNAQKYTRGYLARKRFAVMKVKYTKEPFLTVAKIWSDLSCFERQLSATLRSIIRGFLEPLRKKCLTEDGVTYLFGNVKELRRFHEGIKMSLENKYQAWPEVKGAFQIYMDNAQEFGRRYRDYLGTVAPNEKLHVPDSLLKEGATQELFDKTLREQERKHQVTLVEALSSPVDGFLTGYLQLFGKFSAFSGTPFESNPEIAPLIKESTACCAEFQKAITFAQNRTATPKKKDVAVKSLPELIRRMHSIHIKLDDGVRTFVQEGTLTLTANCSAPSESALVKYFLLSDMLIIAKADSKKFKAVRVIDLRTNPIFTRLDGAKFELMAIGQGGTQHNDFLYFTDAPEAAELFEKLRAAVFSLCPQKVYGVALPELVLRESRPSGVPQIIEICCGHLSKNINTEGMFRQGGRFEKVNSLKNALNSLQPSTDLTGYSVHEVATVLKRFLNELPEPVITFDAYNKLMSLDPDGPRERFVDESRRILHGMQPSHLTVACHLFKFLHNVVLASDFNKMDSYNLGTVLGPNVMRPSIITDPYLMTKSNGVVEKMIEWYDAIFL
eukprot:TRINITY_DN5606_c0_g1_i1.p1 TRINITY_DN5606_c0_g1~~TRINITY_DN5606_c0_g1_i1.p1  ORF type:complete len:803 (+),score=184.04 TRINITY_DN5606_c0_g1_i1:417-2825(+)